MHRLFTYIWIIFAITCFSTNGYGQQSPNPFDLKYRNARTSEESPKKNKEAAADSATKPSVKQPTKRDLKQGAQKSEEKDPNPFEAGATNNKANTKTPDSSRTEDGGKDSISPHKNESAVNIGDGPSELIKRAGGKRSSMLLLIVLAISLIATLVISYNRSVIQRTWRAILNDNYLNLIYREQKGGLSLQYLFLYFIFVVNAGLFIYLSIGFFKNAHYPILWKCIAFVGIIYVIRHSVLNYLSGVYPFKKELEQYGFTILIFNVFFGIILLPLNAFVAFSPPAVSKASMYIGLIFFGLLLIFRLLRGLFIGSRYLIGHRFHFFLYLCATEIAPIFLVIKFFKSFLI
jgi:hypothetical protein